MSDYYICSCSCGKDSLAMALRLIEEKYPLNEIVFYDTGMEFSAIYRNWQELKLYAEACGIKCTVLHPKCPFLYKMFYLPVNVGKNNEHKGYSWCGGRCRWGTTEKLKSLDRYCEQKQAYCYVGIAHDETKRLIKERKPYKIFPLDEWKMTEADCLQYCRDRNISWLERSGKDATGYVDLYNILDRVSCYCCGNKNLWELRNIWFYLPDYWNKLCDLQRNTDRPFKKELSIFDLAQKFESGYVPKHITRKKGDGKQ